MQPGTSLRCRRCSHLADQPAYRSCCGNLVNLCKPCRDLPEPWHCGCPAEAKEWIANAMAQEFLDKQPLDSCLAGPVQCGASKLTVGTLAQHLRGACLALRLCSCGLLFATSSWPAHQDTCEHCSTPCKWCQGLVARREMSQHVAEACAVVTVECADCPFRGPRATVLTHQCLAREVRRLQRQLTTEREAHATALHRLWPPVTMALAAEAPLTTLLRTPAVLGAPWAHRIGDCCFQALQNQGKPVDGLFRVGRTMAVAHFLHGRPGVLAFTSGDERVFIVWARPLGLVKQHWADSTYCVGVQVQNTPLIPGTLGRNCFFRATRLPGSSGDYELAMTCDLWSSLELRFRSEAELASLFGGVSGPTTSAASHS